MQWLMLDLRNLSRLRALTVLVLAQVFACRRAAAVVPPPPAALERVAKLSLWARGLEEPIGIEFPPGFSDVEGYVVEKAGRVRIVQVQDGQARVDPVPWVDLSDRVSTGSEQGLLGLAFHPQFKDNGRIYLNYTDKNGDSNVIEMRRAPGAQRIDPGCSITGGFVYRGSAMPELDGHYFYADYCTSLIRSLRMIDGKVSEQYSWRAALDPDAKIARLASFGQDQSGELYLVSQEGAVYKLVRGSTARPR